MDEIDLSFDINLDDFSDIEIELDDSFDSRYIKPPKTKQVSDRFLKYSNAEKLAKDIDITPKNKGGS